LERKAPWQKKLNTLLTLTTKEDKMRKLFAVPILCLLPTLATAQKSLSVEIVNQNEKTVTLRVTNNSDKPVTCYSVAIDITYSDGNVHQSQESECYYAADRMLAPGASLEHTSHLSPSHGTIAKVEVQPTLAVFQDGSSEKRDDKSWHILMDSVKSNNDGERDILTVVQQSNNDPVKAASALEPLKQKAAPGSPYETRLKSAITFLKTNPSPDDVKAFVGRVQHAYDLHKPYANANASEVTKP
jgi:hypothetical protein